MVTNSRVALVTGASRGLGFVVTRFLLGEGFRVIGNARSVDPLREAADKLADLGHVVLVAGDISLPEARGRLVRAVDEAGHLDVLVNNASELGPSPLPPLTELSLDQLDRILRVNLFAPLALVQALLPRLKKAHGLVVNISSDAALGGYPGWGGYGASKAALDLVSRTLARELEGSGVGVVSVDPGDIRTAMHQLAFPGQDISDRPLPEITLPFWAWLFGQEPARVNGGRFQAQADRWEVPR